MPEPGEVRDGLVWTGSEWIPLKSPDAESDHQVAQVDGPSTEPQVCPHCRQSDRLIRVSGLVDRSKTSETGYTFGAGVGVGTGGIGVGIGDAVTQTDGTNALAERFGLHRPTVYGGCWISAAGLLAFILVGGALSLLSIDGGALGSILAIAILAVAGFWYSKYLKFEKTWKALYAEALKKIRAGYYCERCDLAFSPGADSAEDPEEYVKAIFSAYNVSFKKAVEQVPLLSKIPRIRKLLAGENPGQTGQLFDYR